MVDESRMKKAFQKGLGLKENFQDYEALEFSKSELWDSIGHMKLIAALEEEFGISIDINDILGMSSYPIAREIIQKYTAKST